MILAAATALRDFAVAALERLGSDAVEAAIVAEHLVDANLTGHDSHGVGLLPAYAANLRKGVLLANRRGRVAMESGPLAAVEGDGGYGQVIARDAMAVAIRLAQAHGVAVVALRRTHHIGRVGAYGEQLAEAGLASLHFVNGNSGPPPVAPWGGREGRFATNPVWAWRWPATSSPASSAAPARSSPAIPAIAASSTACCRSRSTRRGSMAAATRNTTRCSITCSAAPRRTRRCRS